MSKEEDLERFDIEYSLFEVGDCISAEGSKNYIEVVLGDLDDHIKQFRDEIRSDNISKLRAKFANYFSYFIGYEYPEYYEKDSLVVKRQVKFNRLINSFFLKLLDVVNESNFLDVFKLCSFIRDKYFVYYWYLEKERTAVELEFSGCYMNVPEPFDILKLKEFLDREINRISLSRNVEKKKVL